ncbi:JAB domain-containing protein [Maribacter sp.]|nr:JAB domain-containing protein [Maribacter sp.]
MKTKNHKTSYLLELHYKRPLNSEMFKINDSKDVDLCLRDNINLKRIDHKEFFWMILLTRANRVLGISEISSGKTNSTAINYKEIVQLVALSNASAVILAHNHPSGQLKPSSCDLSMTKHMGKILKLIEVTLCDHIIITSEGYYSFSDNFEITHPNP